jgi:hypothetical protein
MAISNSKFNAAVYAAIDLPVLPEGTQVIRGEGWYQVVNPELKLSGMVRHPQYRCFVAAKDGQVVGSAATVLKEGMGI